MKTSKFYRIFTTLLFVTGFLFFGAALYFFSTDKKITAIFSAMGGAIISSAVAMKSTERRSTE